MEAVIFMGAQACGKSTYYKLNFVDTHIRLNLDMLKTRYREKLLFEACLEAKQSFVIDNTNPLKTDRARYIGSAKKSGFEVKGYYFSSSVKEAVERNHKRGGDLPDHAILCTCGKLELPDYEEGFDKLYFVKIIDNHFQTEEWNHEL